MKDRLLSVTEASEILGLKRKTLYMWKWKNLHLPFIKVGKSLRISERDLFDFIEKGRKPLSKKNLNSD